MKKRFLSLFVVLLFVGGIVGPSASVLVDEWLAKREAERQLAEAWQLSPEQDWGSATDAQGRVRHSGHVVEDGEANTAKPVSERSKYPPLTFRDAAGAGRANTSEVLPSPSKATGFDPAASRELPERREENRSTFQNPDGTQTTLYSQSPRNYRAADGTWKPVDSTLVADGRGWRNTADGVRTRFADRADSADLATLELDGEHSFGYGLRDAAPAAGTAEGATVTYRGVLPDADLRVQAGASSFKEDLVLHSPNAPSTWLFPLRLKGLTAQVVDNQVVLRDGSGADRAVIPAGFMTDSKIDSNTGDPATSYGVRYEIVTSQGAPALKVELDRGWLTDPARQYPVVVDPSVLEKHGGIDSSMYVQRTNGVSRSVSDGLELKVGRATGGGTHDATTYLKFPGIENELRNHRIFNAQLFLLNYYSWSCSPRPMTVHGVNSAWTAGPGHTYPGPAVGGAIASSSFAQGYLASGSNSSACPASGQAIPFGDAGRDLVQRWVNHEQPNFGLSLRGSESDVYGWKKIAGHRSQVPPTLYITHSPYNASYRIENGVPTPPIARNQDGVVKVKVTNLGKDTWTPGSYFLAYRKFNSGGVYQAETEAAQLPHDVPRGGSVTLDAKVQRTEPGYYTLEFSMVHKGVKVFTDEQVAPARLGFQVFDVPPIVTGQYPPNGHSAPTLAQQLWVNATDVDAPGGSSLKYRFEVCEADRQNQPVGGSCFDSGRIDRATWTVPPGKLRWSKTYLWRAFAFDGVSESEALPYSALLTAVPQPEITSQIGAAPYSGGDRDFNPSNGNYTSSAVDASVATVGPDLTVGRTYNSLDPRRHLAFGAGWVSRLDMKVVAEDDNNAVVTYPDGQAVRFGANLDANGNPDRTYAPPPGRYATFVRETGGAAPGWVLIDKSFTTYKFDVTGKLTQIHDAHDRRLDLSYTGDRVTEIRSSASSRSLLLDWTANGRHVAKIRIQETATKVLEWKYDYSDNNAGDDLVSVCNPRGECTGYEYEAGSHYRSAVMDSTPKHYWRLGETAGDKARSQVSRNLGKDDATYDRVTRGVASPIAGNSDAAAGFDGTATVRLPRETLRLSRDVAVEMWFRTTANGPLLGYQSKPIGEDAPNGVPLLYVGQDGKLRGQFWNNAVAPITTPNAVNDGKWHHVALSGSLAKQTLFLDGTAVGSVDGVIDHANLSEAQLGAAFAPVVNAWPSYGEGKRRFFTGEIDEFAVYEHPLGSTAIAAHRAEQARASSQLTKITLPSGRVTSTIAYDKANDRASEVVDADGGKWKIDLPVMTGSEQNLVRTINVTDPGERLHTYDYDAVRNRILRYLAPVGMSVRPEDRKPQAAVTTPNENCIPPTSVEDGAPVFCVGRAGAQPPEYEDSFGKSRGVRTYDYDQSGFQHTIADELGNQMTLVHDERGNVKSTKNCRRNATDCQTSYVEHYHSPDITDARNDKVLVERDARSSGPTDDTYATRYSYTVAGELLSHTSPSGEVVSHAYTNINNDTSVDNKSLQSGLLKTTTHTGNGQTALRYFTNGDLAQARNAAGLTTKYTYDALGRKVTETEVSTSFPSGLTTTFTYDDLSRVLTSTEPAVRNPVSGVTHTLRTTYEYDKDGNQTKVEVSDLTGGDRTRTALLAYDDRGRLAEETDAEGRKTSHGYDVFGNKSWTVSTGGIRTEFAYTARNKIAEVRLRGYSGDPIDPTKPNDGQVDETDPDAGNGTGEGTLVVHSYFYDLAGRLFADIDSMGRTSRYRYYRDNSLHQIIALGVKEEGVEQPRDIVVQDNAYDAAGNLARRTVAGGLVTEYTNDAAGRVTKIVQDPTGVARTTDMVLDATGRVTQVSRTGNTSNVTLVGPSTTEVTEFRYDAAGRQVEEIVHKGAERLTTKRAYDQYDQVLKEIDPRGVADAAKQDEYTNSYVYDAKQRLVELEGPLVAAETGGQQATTGRAKMTSGYNAFGQLTHHRDTSGDITETSYDNIGRQVVKRSPAYTPPGAGTPVVPEVRTSYDPDGNVVATVDAGGAVTRFKYNQLGQMVEKTDPKADDPGAPGGVSRFTYLRTGELLSATDPTGATVKQTYDDLKRPITRTNLERRPTVAAYTSKFRYDDAGRVLSSTSPLNEVSRQQYDKLGQKVRTIEPDGVTTNFGYDHAGRQVRVVDGEGRTTDHVFNQVGWLIGSVNIGADGAVIRNVQVKHDQVGNVVEEIDARGRSTKFAYDAADRLVRQVEPVSDTKTITSTFGYDIGDRQTRFTDGRGNATYTHYNALGLPEKVVEPATAAHPEAADRTWTTSYDVRGLPTKVQAPGGVERVRAYDALGRLTTETGTGTAQTTRQRTREYDLAGRVTAVDSRDSKNTYAYNDRGQLLDASGPSGRSTFKYDPVGRLASSVDASGTNNYKYANGRLSSVQDGITGALQSYGYNKAGDVKSIGYGGGTTRTYGYDALGRLAEDKLANSAGTSLASMTYGYDLNDHLSSKVTTGTAGATNNTYDYDHSGRLTSWTTGASTTAYEWDDSGNRVRAGDKTSTFDERNRLLSDGDYTYKYSARGTMESRTSSGFQENYGFDAFDRLVKRGSSTYDYDGLDRMIGRNAVAFSYSGFGLDPVGDGESTYSRGEGGGLLAIGKGDSKKLAVNDRHGDLVGTLTPGGSPTALTDSATYDPFGQRTATSGDKHKVGYQGDWTDEESGQVNMGARWYSPGSGSFISRDDIALPSSPSISANRYAYAGGAPLDRVDPDGHWWDWVEDAGRAVGKATTATVNWVKNDGLNFVKEVSGYNDVVGCLTNPSWGGCAMAALNFIPGGKVVNLGIKGVKAGVKAVKATKIGRAADNLGGGAAKLGGKADDFLKAAGKVVTETRWVKVGGKMVKQTFSKVIGGGAKYGAGAARAVARSAGDVIRAMPGHQFAKMAAEQAAKRIPPSTFAALRKPMLAAKDVVVSSPFSPANIVSHALDGVVDGGAVLDFFRSMVLKSGDDVIKDAPAAARAGSEMAQGAGARVDDMARPGRMGGSKSDDLTGKDGGASCLVGKTQSFVPGTLVLMADGSRKKIEDLRADDQVLATDPTTDVTAAKRVTEVRSVESLKTMVEIAVTTDGADSEITATDEHPFWVESEQRWVHAVDLKPGYRFLTADNRSAVVGGTRTWSGVQLVHNFTVDGLHTYYVAASTTSVLVHNCGEDVYKVPDVGVKHGTEAVSSGRGSNSSEPLDGQGALNNSVQIKPTSDRRVGMSSGQVVILDQTGTVPCGCTVEGGVNNVFHGHVRSDFAKSPAMQKARNALGKAIKSGAVKR